MQLINTIYILFSIIATFIWLFQIITAFIFNVKKTTIKYIKKSVSVIIPSYNEEQQNIEKTIQSILQNNIEDIEIIIIDDGSKLPIQIDNRQVKLIRLNKNKGKRNALQIGIREATKEITVLVDSDTSLKNNAIQNAINEMFSREADAICGNILLSNEKENFLTFLIKSMYYVSFNFERASQSLFNTVTCCSGGFSIYKTKDLKDISHQINDQYVFGVKSRAGDDRHITSLLLLKNKKIIWSKNSIAYTETPSKYLKFIKQQKRWARSLILECIWLFQYKNKMSLFYKYDVLKKIFKLFYLILTYIFILYWLFQLNLIWTLYILSIIIVKAAVLFLFSKKIELPVSLILMGMLSYFLLTPFMLYASFTPFQTNWLTRKT